MRWTRWTRAWRCACSDTQPDHGTLCGFRRKNAALLSRAFAQVLELAANCGGLKVGVFTVAIDGTKVLANASKHAAVSHGHAEQTLRELDLEIAELMAKAEIEARAYVRSVAEPADYAKKLARREALQSEGKTPRGRPPEPPSSAPGEKDQVNFTDEESRMEWDLVCLAYNVKRLHRLGAFPESSRGCRGLAKPVAPRTSARLAARKPAQTGFGGVAAWFNTLENSLHHLLARLRVRLQSNSAKIHFSGCVLSPTGC